MACSFHWPMSANQHLKCRLVAPDNEVFQQLAVGRSVALAAHGHCAQVSDDRFHLLVLAHRCLATSYIARKEDGALIFLCSPGINGQALCLAN